MNIVYTALILFLMSYTVHAQESAHAKPAEIKGAMAEYGESSSLEGSLIMGLCSLQNNESVTVANKYVPSAKDAGNKLYGYQMSQMKSSKAMGGIFLECNFTQTKNCEGSTKEECLKNQVSLTELLNSLELNGDNCSRKIIIKSRISGETELQLQQDESGVTKAICGLEQVDQILATNGIIIKERVLTKMPELSIKTMIVVEGNNNPWK